MVILTHLLVSLWLFDVFFWLFHVSVWSFCTCALVILCLCGIFCSFFSVLVSFCVILCLILHFCHLFFGHFASLSHHFMFHFEMSTVKFTQKLVRRPWARTRWAHFENTPMILTSLLRYHLLTPPEGATMRVTPGHPSGPAPELDKR